MKKRLSILFTLAAMCTLFATSAGAEEITHENSYQNPLPVSITADSKLTVSFWDWSTEEEVAEVDLSVPTGLEYQEIVLPYGTDPSNLSVEFKGYKLNFSMDAAAREAHGITSDAEKEYYNYLRERMHRWISYCAGDSDKYISHNEEPLEVQDGQTYTLSIGSPIEAYPKEDDFGPIHRYYSDKRFFLLQQSRKFAFTVRVEGPEITEGATKEIEEGTAETHTVKIRQNLQLLLDVQLEGKSLNFETDYTVAGSDEGMSVILSESFMKALPVGEYKLQIRFTGGTSVAKIKVNAVQTPDPTPDPSNKDENTNKPAVTTPTNGTAIVNGKVVLYKDGKAVTGTTTAVVAGKTYAVKNGFVVTGKKQLVTIGKKTYLVDKKGVVQKASKNRLTKIGKKSYIVSKAGVLQKSKVLKVGKKTYAVNKKGIVQKASKKYKLVTIGKKKYIVNKKGYVQLKKKTIKIGKVKYTTNKKGVARKK